MAFDDKDIGAYLGIVVNTYDEDHLGQIEVQLMKTGLGDDKQSTIWVRYINQADVCGFGFQSIPQTGDTVMLIVMGGTNNQIVALTSFNGILDGIQHMDKSAYGQWSFYNGMWLKDKIEWDSLGPKQKTYEVVESASDAGKNKNTPLVVVKAKNKPDDTSDGKASNGQQKGILEKITSLATNAFSLVIDEQDPLNPRMSITAAPSIDRFEASKDNNAANLPISIIEMSAKNGIRMFSNKEISFYTDTFNLTARDKVNITTSALKIDTGTLTAVSDSTMSFTSQRDIKIDTAKGKLLFNQGERPSSEPVAAEVDALSEGIGDLLTDIEVVLPKLTMANKSSDYFTVDMGSKAVYASKKCYAVDQKSEENVGFKIIEPASYSNDAEVSEETQSALFDAIFNSVRVKVGSQEVTRNGKKVEVKKLTFELDARALFQKFEQFNQVENYIMPSAESEVEFKTGKIINPYSKFVELNSQKVGFDKKGKSLFLSSQLRVPDLKVHLVTYNKVSKKASEIGVFKMNDENYSIYHNKISQTSSPLTLKPLSSDSHFKSINVIPYEILQLAELKSDESFQKFLDDDISTDGNYQAYIERFRLMDNHLVASGIDEFTILFAEGEPALVSNLSDLKIQVIRRTTGTFSGEDHAVQGVEIDVERVQESVTGDGTEKDFRVGYKFSPKLLEPTKSSDVMLDRRALSAEGYQTGKVKNQSLSEFFNDKVNKEKYGLINPMSFFMGPDRTGAFDSYIRIHNLFKFKAKGVGEADDLFHDIDGKEYLEKYKSSYNKTFKYSDYFPAKGIYPALNNDGNPEELAGNTLVIDVSDQYNRLVAGLTHALAGATGALAYFLGNKFFGKKEEKVVGGGGVKLNTGELDMHDITKDYVKAIEGTTDKIGRLSDGPDYQSAYYYGDKVIVKFKKVSNLEFSYTLKLQTLDETGTTLKNLLDPAKVQQLTFNDKAEHTICLNDYLADGKKLIPIGSYVIFLDGNKTKDMENDIAAAVALDILPADCDLFITDKSEDLPGNESKIALNYGSISNYMMGKYSRYKSGAELAFCANYQFNIASKLSSNAGIVQHWQLHIYPAGEIDHNEDFLNISAISTEASDNAVMKTGGGSIEPIWSSGEIKYPDNNTSSADNVLVQSEVDGEMKPLALKVGDYIVVTKGEILYGEPDANGKIDESKAFKTTHKDLIVLTIRAGVELFNDTQAYPEDEAVTEKKHGYYQVIYQGSTKIDDKIVSDDKSYRGFNYYVDDFPYLGITFAFTDRQEHSYSKSLVNIGTGDIIDLPGEDKFEDGIYTMNLDGIVPEAGYYKLTVVDADDDNVIDNLYFRLYDKSSISIVLDGNDIFTPATASSPIVYTSINEVIRAALVYNAFKVGIKTNIAAYYKIINRSGVVTYMNAISSISGGSPNSKEKYSEKADPKDPSSENIVTGIPVYTLESGKSVSLQLVCGPSFLAEISGFELVVVNISEGFKTIAKAMVAS